MRAKTALVAGLVSALFAVPVSIAQEGPSLLEMLRSPDWQVRHRALVEFNDLALGELPAGARSEAIGLLEREATGAQPRPEVEGEGYGEYLIELVQFVLRFEDPASLRGMVLQGLRMSKQVRKFVASHGAESLPHLEEAWREGHQHAVMLTWGEILGSYADRLSPERRLEVMRRLLEAAPDDPLAFAWAVDAGELVAAVPVLERIAAEGRFERERGRARARRADAAARFPDAEADRRCAGQLAGCHLSRRGVGSAARRV